MRKIYYVISLLCVLLFASCKEEENRTVELDAVQRNITITDIYPECGYRGDEFTITGTDFGVSAELVKVYLGGQPLEVLSCEDTELRVKTSAESTAGTISVEILGTLVNSDLLYDVLGVPGVTKISQHFGFSGDEITFEGHDFGTEPGMVNLKFSGAAGIAQVVSCENEKFVVRVPEDAKTGEITLSIASQNVFVSFGEDAVFTVPKHAGLENVVPDAAAKGCTVTLNGTNFTYDMKVFFGESMVPATEIALADDGESLKVKIPEALEEGDNRITVSTIYETVSTKLDFVVKPAPVFTSISKDEEYVGKTIEINGNYFGTRTEDIKVKFNGKEGEIVSCDETRIEVRIPVLDDYTGPSEVEMSLLGLTIDTESLSFTVLEAPIIDRITSTNVLNKNGKSEKIAYSDGDNLLITGSGFAKYGNDKITIKVNGTDTSVKEVDNQSIKAVLPADLTGNVNIEISFNGYVESFTYNDIEFAKISSGTDITEYVLVNYKQKFVSVDGNTYDNWAIPYGWNINDAAKSKLDAASFPVGGMYINPASKNEFEHEGVLIMQAGWGCTAPVYNGKIWQVAYLPSGTYNVTVKVHECEGLNDGDNSIRFMIAEGDELPDYTSGISGHVFAAKQTGEKTWTENISVEGEYSIGLLAYLSAENRNIKISSIKIEKQ